MFGLLLVPAGGSKPGHEKERLVQESEVPSASPSLPLPKCVSVDNFLSLPGSKFHPLLNNGGFEFNVLLLKMWSTYKVHGA